MAHIKSQSVFEFYNLLLEKLSDEPKGREIFYIDPIIKGNFAS